MNRNAPATDHARLESQAIDAMQRGLIRAHVLITLLPKVTPRIEAELRAIPEVRTLHSVSGSYDLIAIGAVSGVGEMDVLTDRIGAIDGVERTTSSVVLSTKFER